MMLSLGNLAVGQAVFYVDQARGATMRTTAVASGVEDDYLAGHEASGRWIGRARLCSGSPALLLEL